MKNKKGFLLAEETLKIILAVISIGFLIYFLTALYFANQNSEKLEQAKASLEHLIEGINSEIEEIEIYNPKGAYILSWPFEDEGNFPDSCNGKSCICIVVNVNVPEQLWAGFGDAEGVRKSILDKSDICIENTKNLIVKKEGTKQQVIPIEPPLTLQINYDNKIISKKSLK